MNPVTATPPAPPTAAPPVDPTLAYHRLARTARPHRWWRPLLVLVVVAAVYLVLLAVSLVVTVVPGTLVELATGTTAFTPTEELDLGRPVDLLAAVLSLAVLLPAALIGVRLVGRRPAGTLTSVAGRMRWRLLGVSALITAVVFTLTYGVLLVLDPPATAGVPDVGRAIALLAVALLLVPFQAAGEEYVFRGLALQTVGAWLRSPWWGILLPVPLFVIGHDYDPLGLLAVGVFAVAAGWLTWRSGGLELAIGLHVVNNVAVFALGAFGLVDPNATEVSASVAAVDIGYTVVVTAACWLYLRRAEAATATAK